jgi:hypothetical protein
MLATRWVVYPGPVTIGADVTGATAIGRPLCQPLLGQPPHVVGFGTTGPLVLFSAH